MARRKGWDELSPTYRHRLERSGITAADYRSGTPLTAARGHRTTPERPAQAERHPDRYAEYRSRLNLQRIVRELEKSGLAPSDYELEVLKEQFGAAGRRAILAGQLRAHRAFAASHGDKDIDYQWFYHDGPDMMEHYEHGLVDTSQYIRQLWYYGQSAA